MPIHTKARCAALALALTASGGAGAGGFAIITQSSSAAGNAFAGAASAAEDTGTIWYNPAGMTNLEGIWNFSLVANAVKTSFKFNDRGSTGAFAAPGTGDGGDGGAWGPPAQLYASKKLTDSLVAGLAVNTPFGLKTDYDPGWRGRFAAIRSEVKAFNFNPALAYRVTENLSVGGGFSAQYFETELTNNAGAAGIARLKADDTGWGWNVGALVKVPDTTARIGFAYRSSINYDLKGRVTFSGGGGTLDSDAQAGLTVPETFAVSGFSALGRWDLMAGATWTRWSRVKRITVVRTTPSGLGPVGSIVNTLDFDWRDTLMLSAGTSYRASDDWKVRLGIGFDPRASNDTTRTPRLPDEARLLVTAGVNYKLPRKWGTIDFSYLHDFVKDAAINEAVAGVPGRLIGTFRSKADVVSLQYNGRF